MTGPIKVLLDRERAVRWTNRAQARMGSLVRPVTFADLARPRRQLYSICALLWSALIDREHPFEAPEDLAEHLATLDQQLAALRAITAMVEEAFPPEKKSPATEPASSSANGHEPSYSSASEPVGSTTGT